MREGPAALKNSMELKSVTQLDATFEARPSGLSGQQTKVAKRLYIRHERGILGIVSVSVFLGLWELVPALGLVEPLFISSPSRIFTAAKWLFTHGLWNDIQVSATEFGLGLIMAIIFGVSGGIAMGWYRRVNAIFDPYISALYSTPRVALLPLLIMWLGIGVESKVAVVFLGAVFPILVNMITGMRTIDENLLKCARSFLASDRQIFVTLALPNTLPFLMSGLRLAVGRALLGVVVGEMVASTAGVGHMMYIAGATFQTDKVFVGIALMAGTGYVLTEVIKKVERRLEAWRSHSFI
jgi:ABC-type nitrate/sulfonate/bicarbonate transport system permease component